MIVLGFICVLIGVSFPIVAIMVGTTIRCSPMPTVEAIIVICIGVMAYIRIKDFRLGRITQAFPILFAVGLLVLAIAALVFIYEAYLSSNEWKCAALVASSSGFVFTLYKIWMLFFGLAGILGILALCSTVCCPSLIFGLCESKRST
jgi:hypothetical protein